MRLAALFIVLACSDCGGKSCTALACLDEVTLTLSDARASGDGEYIFDLEADGYRFTQRCSVAGSASCTISGSAPPNQSALVTVYNGGLWAIAIAGTPAQVKITVTKGGVRIGSGSAQPDYATKYPNGPDCPAGCDQAAAPVTIQ